MDRYLKDDLKSQGIIITEDAFQFHIIEDAMTPTYDDPFVSSWTNVKTGLGIRYENHPLVKIPEAHSIYTEDGTPNFISLAYSEKFVQLLLNQKIIIDYNSLQNAREYIRCNIKERLMCKTDSDSDTSDTSNDEVSNDEVSNDEVSNDEVEMDSESRQYMTTLRLKIVDIFLQRFLDSKNVGYSFKTFESLYWDDVPKLYGLLRYGITKYGSDNACIRVLIKIYSASVYTCKSDQKWKYYYDCIFKHMTSLSSSYYFENIDEFLIKKLNEYPNITKVSVDNKTVVSKNLKHIKHVERYNNW